MKWTPHIIHANDWQASLMNVYLRFLYREEDFFKQTKSVLTIHNLAYQGLFDKSQYAHLGLPQEYFTTDYFEYYGKMNLLKSGIVCADMVNTVSPTYAKQIQTSNYGCGLEGVLREKREYLCGILNAIDDQVWNPKTDAFLKQTYASESIEDKSVNKLALQKKCGLKVSKDILLLGMVSRLAEQKGVDILCEALDVLLPAYQIVILGFGEEKYHQILKKKAGQYPKSISLHLKFDEQLAHQIYSGSDCFLLPSRFEPCGLSQMISYKYGTVPIVHHTGGLVDTVVDVVDGGGGFVFEVFNAHNLSSAIRRAHAHFKKTVEWKKLLNKIMSYNFSWQSTADQYRAMYRRVTKNSFEPGLTKKA
jgi:starch synthase